MSLSFDFDSSNKILRCRLEGLVDNSVLAEIYRLLPKYDAATQARAVIYDLSEVTTVDISTQTIADLAMRPPALADKSRAESRPRVSVASKDHVFGLLRMFQSMGERAHPDRHVVRTMEGAYELLGVTDPKFEIVRLEPKSASAKANFAADSI